MNIEASMEVVQHEIPGSETVSWPTPFWIKDDMVQTQNLLLLNNGCFPGELERSHIFGGIFNECIKNS